MFPALLIFMQACQTKTTRATTEFFKYIYFVQNKCHMLMVIFTDIQNSGSMPIKDKFYEYGWFYVVCKFSGELYMFNFLTIKTNHYIDLNIQRPPSTNTRKYHIPPFLSGRLPRFGFHYGFVTNTNTVQLIKCTVYSMNVTNITQN